MEQLGALFGLSGDSASGPGREWRAVLCLFVAVCGLTAVSAPDAPTLRASLMASACGSVTWEMLYTALRVLASSSAELDALQVMQTLPSRPHALMTTVLCVHPWLCTLCSIPDVLCWLPRRWAHLTKVRRNGMREALGGSAGWGLGLN